MIQPWKTLTCLRCRVGVVKIGDKLVCRSCHRPMPEPAEPREAHTKQAVSISKSNKPVTLPTVKFLED